MPDERGRLSPVEQGRIPVEFNGRYGTLQDDCPDCCRPTSWQIDPQLFACARIAGTGELQVVQGDRVSVLVRCRHCNEHYQRALHGRDEAVATVAVAAVPAAAVAAAGSTAFGADPGSAGAAGGGARPASALDQPAPDLLEWTAARLGTWLFEQQGLCIAAAALVFAALAALILRDLRRLRRTLVGEARLRALLALGGREAVALRVREARRDGAPGVDWPGAVGPGMDGPGAVGRPVGGAVFPMRVDQEPGLPAPRDADLQSREVDRGAGRMAAGLIMTALSVDEAQAIFDGHSAAARRTDPAWAAWAMLWRFEMAGDPAAAQALAAAFGATGILCIDAAAADALERLYFEGGVRWDEERDGEWDGGPDAGRDAEGRDGGPDAEGRGAPHAGETAP